MDGIATQCGMMGRAAQAQPFGLASRDFDESLDQYIDLGDDNAFTFVDGSGDLPFSLAFWAKRATGGVVVVSKFSNASPLVGEYNLTLNDQGILLFQIMDGFPTIRCRQDSDLSYPDNTWTHVVGTYDGTGTDAGIKIYVNGAVAASTGFGEDGSYVQMDNSTSPLLIGSALRDWVNGAANSDGKIADVRIYGSELTPTQIADLHSGIDVTANLINRWIGNDDIVGSVVPDLSGNGRDGTNNGSTYSTDGPLD